MPNDTVVLLVSLAIAAVIIAVLLIREIDRTPHYTSTYCQHGLHDRCRLTCKTCNAGCRCDCHKAKG